MLGDNADIYLIGTVGRLIVQVAAMTGRHGGRPDHDDRHVEDHYGGADTMSGNAGNDIMLGGVNNGGDRHALRRPAAPNATTIANDGDDILLGDNGLLDFTLDARRRPQHARPDPLQRGRARRHRRISGTRALDVAIGGTGGDTIYGDDADAARRRTSGDILLGDNADIFLVAARRRQRRRSQVVLGAAVKTIAHHRRGRTRIRRHRTRSPATPSGDIIAGGVAGRHALRRPRGAERRRPTPTTATTSSSATTARSSGCRPAGSTRSPGIDIAGEQCRPVRKYVRRRADTDLDTLDLITTEQPTNGGRDLIYGDEGSDVVFGGTDADTIYGDDGNENRDGDRPTSDLLFGDHGRLYPQFSTLHGRGNSSCLQLAQLLRHRHRRRRRRRGRPDVGRGRRRHHARPAGRRPHVGRQRRRRHDRRPQRLRRLRRTGRAGDRCAAAVDPGRDRVQRPDGRRQRRRRAWPATTPSSGAAATTSSPRFRALDRGERSTRRPSDTITANVTATGRATRPDAVGRDITLLDHSDDVQADPQGRFGKRRDGGRRRQRHDVRRARQRPDAGRRRDRRCGACGDPVIARRTSTMTDTGSNPARDGTLSSTSPSALPTATTTWKATAATT